MTIQLEVDGRQVEVHDDQASLLDVLRGELGLTSAKDGCSPQGQCGCCTVLIDGQPRVACVTPVRRVAGRSVTTLEGLSPEERATWAAALCATGGTQCGFCTPGIVVRLEGLRRRGTEVDDHGAVERALAAHLCRCTGWRTIVEAWDLAVPALTGGPALPEWPAARDVGAAERRAALEGGVPQQVGPQVALGRAGFADDDAPQGALVAVPDGGGGWAVGETLREARAVAGKVQGRRTTVEPEPPLRVPPGDWDVTLQTGWVEPAYLETDASWCAPGGQPASPLANGGAFGGKSATEVGAVARRLADEHGRPVRVLLAREDTVRRGPKRPPVAGGVRADGTGVLRVARTPGVGAVIAAVAPDLVVEEVAVAGPPTSVAIRGAGWLEAAVLVAAATGAPGVRSPWGSHAEAEIRSDGTLAVRVACGDPLDEVVLRSYCIGAAHQGLGWVTSEGISVDADGEVHDLTVRSFGVLRSIDMPVVDIELVSGGPPVNGSDAVVGAVALAVWRQQGLAPRWPTGVALGGR